MIHSMIAFVSGSTCNHSLIYFHARFSTREGRKGCSRWRTRNNSWWKQSLIVLLASHHDRTKQVRICRHGILSLDDICAAFPWAWIPHQGICLNFSTCCSVLPLTCSVHRLSFLERHNTLVLSVLILIPAWSHAEENISSACWRPCSEDESSTKSLTISKRLILLFPNGGNSSAQLSFYPIHM